MNKLFIAVAGLILVLTAFVTTLTLQNGGGDTPKALGGVSQGTEGTIATSTTLNAPSRTAFTATPGRTATSTGCSARSITTRGAVISLSFATTTPYEGTPYFQVTAATAAGHTQAASTTVVYDSQFWGCGAIQIWSDAAQTLTITEVQ